MQHLRSLAKAGLTHVHLLPSFDFSSVPELASEQKTPQIVQPISAPDSEQPEDAIDAVKDQDGFNWGYDPYHYGTPEGNYSTDPNGITRIREFREMVESLHSPAIKPGFDAINSAHLYFEDILRIRKSSPLFRLQTGDEVKQRVKFYNVGPSQQPALIVMAISDKVGRKLDPDAESIVVLFNVDKIAKTISLPDYAGIPLELHPILRNSIADLVVKQSQYNASTGTFTIPPRTTAVFLETGEEKTRNGIGLYRRQ